MKYSDYLAKYLKKNGYTHCFYLSGGNIMHLQNSFRTHFSCIPIIHEVAAGIASEYFNELNLNNKKAFALVTAGPGLTNIVTSIAGAFLESRELLVIGGQVKREDLSNGDLIQRGIQEIDGHGIVKNITKLSKRFHKPLSDNELDKIIKKSFTGRKGPVFMEIPLDVQGANVNFKIPKKIKIISKPKIRKQLMSNHINMIKNAKRPSILLGGGISRFVASKLQKKLTKLDIPIFTTWNAADRICSTANNYFGRPNTWGQRHSNIIIQQSDLLIALGTRLGLQQSGFNWREFIKNGDIIQVDIDKKELTKKHPFVKYPINSDANEYLKSLLEFDLGRNFDWMKYCKGIKNYYPLNDRHNKTRKKYISPYDFYKKLSNILTKNDIVIPCSSGGAYTTFQQSFLQKYGQLIANNKGLASMGYGLSGAIGASFSDKDKRTIHIEGDGGLTQNMQEFGTVSINNLNIKTFIFDDNGYASIRMTQKNYFKGAYMGCDKETLLGIPNWDKLFKSWNISFMKLNPNFEKNKKFLNLMNQKKPAVFVVPIDPLQTYYPKITSRITSKGSMESNPIHLMSPLPSKEEIKKFFKFI
tara:strand:- start:11032 stop:12786 length:1755 start_codon:yes stop_codon:yes gene_type:complete